jgi:hypothetical protein
VHFGSVLTLCSCTWQVLEVRDDSVLPDLCASDVLVRTHAAAVNPLDMRVCVLWFTSTFFDFSLIGLP